MLKTIALYLPQFHEVKENSLWWGEGYTDWVACRNARPLFEGHYQPHIPLNHNYYDLLDKKTMEYQADLAHHYSIDGFCFYHYWFKDGKKLLEKPAENLLRWKDIQLPFFFSWANATWARSWSGIAAASAWADTFETKKDKTGNAILLDEKYGIQNDWKIHFLYLLDFFKDERYIKIDDKPVFMIHFSEQMPCLHQMLKFWNKLARENGFSGIYTICPQYAGQDSLVNATMPLANCTVWGTCAKKQLDSGLTLISYDDCWANYLSLKKDEHRTTLWCMQPNYDDSPRRGNKGILFNDNSPEKFKKYFSELYQKSLNANLPFIFINAWNEWGEGMHLEPDEKYGFEYLEAVRDVAKECAVISSSSVQVEYTAEWMQKLSPQAVRAKKIDKIKTDWLNFYISGGSFSHFFERHNFTSIVIYGFGGLGDMVCRALKNEGLNVTAVIDRKVSSTNYGIKVYNPDENIPKCDIIIVTVLNDVDSVVDFLESKSDATVILLESLILECMYCN